MPINKSLEADGRKNSFEPTRGARPYFVTQRPVSRPGGVPSSSDLLRKGMRVVDDPGTRLSELTPTEPTTPVSGEIPPPTITPPVIDHASQSAFTNYGGTAGKPPRSGF